MSRGIQKGAAQKRDNDVFLIMCTKSLPAIHGLELQRRKKTCMWDREREVGVVPSLASPSSAFFCVRLVLHGPPLAICQDGKDRWEKFEWRYREVTRTFLSCIWVALLDFLQLGLGGFERRSQEVPEIAGSLVEVKAHAVAAEALGYDVEVDAAGGDFWLARPSLLAWGISFVFLY